MIVKSLGKKVVHILRRFWREPNLVALFIDAMYILVIRALGMWVKPVMHVGSGSRKEPISPILIYSLFLLITPVTYDPLFTNQ